MGDLIFKGAYSLRGVENPLHSMDIDPAKIIDSLHKYQTNKNYEESHLVCIHLEAPPAKL